MEKIGVRKEIDKLGRICIPKEMRKLYNLEKEVELLVTKEGILVKNPEYVLVRIEMKNDEKIKSTPWGAFCLNLIFSFYYCG